MLEASQQYERMMSQTTSASYAVKGMARSVLWPVSMSLPKNVKVMEACRFPPSKRWELATPSLMGFGLGVKSEGLTHLGLMRLTSAPVSTNA